MNRATVSCPHQSASVPRVVNRFTCALSLYGGKPFLGNCLACVAAGENSAEAATRIHGATARTHPPDKPAVSGCCDPVKP